MHHAPQTILSRISGALVVCAHIARYLLSFGALEGVRIVVIKITSGTPAVLLVRPLYAPHVWTLPGGGVEHAEDARTAAARELCEETGLAAEAATLVHVATYQGMCGAKDLIHVFAAPHTTGELRVHTDWEIVERKFFSLTELPHSLLSNHAQFIQHALHTQHKEG